MKDFIINKDQTEIENILSLLDFSSPYGRNYFFNIEKFYTYGDENEINQDYDNQLQGVKYYRNNTLELEKITQYLVHIKDLKNMYSSKSFILEETDIFDLKLLIQFYQKIHDLIRKININLNIKEIQTDNLLKILDIHNPYSTSFFIPNNHNDLLEELFEKIDETKDEIHIEQNFISNSLKGEFPEVKIYFDRPTVVLKSNQHFHEILNSNSFDIIEEALSFIKIAPRKSHKLILLEDMMNELESKIIIEKNKILKQISENLFKHQDQILLIFNNIGLIDSFIAKVKFGIQTNGIKPEINYSELSITNGTNLHLKSILESNKSNYTPLNINMEQGLSILTGSNMGGKTCVIKTLAQFAYMVHAGLLLPADKVITPLFNGIFISKPDITDIDEGLSSFGQEIFDLKKAWNNKNKHYLFLIDEPAKGTNPYEGKAIAATLASELSQSNSYSMISTHYDKISTNLNCKRFIIRGITDNTMNQLFNFLKNKSFNINKINNFLNHEVIEIAHEEEVPKNALKIMQLFDFDKDFIEKCSEYLNN